MQRWALERADFRNAYHFGNDKFWKIDDFLPGKKAPASPDPTPSIEQEKARLEGMMAAVRTNQVDPMVLPAVFRMTPAEEEAAAKQKASMPRRGLAPHMERKRGIR
jgi:hypothetical protein